MRYDVFVERIARDPALQSAIEAISGLPEAQLLELLVGELMQVAERYKCFSEYAIAAVAAQPAPEADAKEERHTPKVEDTPAVTDLPLAVEPIRIELPQLGVITEKSPLPVDDAPTSNVSALRLELDEIERLIGEEIERDWSGKSEHVSARIVQLRNSQLFLKSQLAVLEKPSPVEEPPMVTEGITSTVEPAPAFDDDDMLYVYGCVARKEGIVRLKEILPTMQGVDLKNPLEIFECNGINVLCSKLGDESFAVASNGLLLLSKEETMRIRAEHAVIVNTARAHASLVPFAWGTVTRCADLSQLLLSAGATHSLLALDEESTSWSVRMLVADQQMADLLAAKGVPAKQAAAERKRRRRFDIKFLEKLLQHQRTIAREVHNVLSICSTEAEVVSMIGLAGGTSEDWKPALHAMYTVPPQNRAHLFVAIVRLQEGYGDQGVMFEIQGRSGELAVQRVGQAISA